MASFSLGRQALQHPPGQPPRLKLLCVELGLRAGHTLSLSFQLLLKRPPGVWLPFGCGRAWGPQPGAHCTPLEGWAPRSQSPRWEVGHVPQCQPAPQALRCGWGVGGRTVGVLVQKRGALHGQRQPRVGSLFLAGGSPLPCAKPVGGLGWWPLHDDDQSLRGRGRPLRALAAGHAARACQPGLSELWWPLAWAQVGIVRIGTWAQPHPEAVAAAAAEGPQPPLSVQG